MTDAMKLTKSDRYFVAGAVAFLMLASVASSARSQGITGVNIVILLRLAGESRALPQLGSCLNTKLRKMPDIEIATAPTDGVRYIVDIIAGRGAGDGIAASLVIAETFPIE